MCSRGRSLPCGTNGSALLRNLGMVDQRFRNPFAARRRKSEEEPRLAHVNDAALEQLCARPDTPAWAIAPAKVMKDAQLSVRRWSPSYWRGHARSYGSNGMARPSIGRPPGITLFSVVCRSM
jgi:hypothetical protein